MKKKMGKKAKPWPELFNKRIKKQGEHWIWTGVTGPAGTPRFPSATAPTNSALALSVFLAEGKMPEHPLYNACEERKCIRPEHLSKKVWPNKERDELIRKRWARSLKYGVTFESIGNDYNVSRQRIEQICKGISAKDSDV